MAKPFVFQRSVDGKWFDAEKFDCRDKAVWFLNRARDQENFRIQSRGGSGYTMERPQRMRVIEIIQ